MIHGKTIITENYKLNGNFLQHIISSNHFSHFSKIKALEAHLESIKETVLIKKQDNINQQGCLNANERVKNVLWSTDAGSFGVSKVKEEGQFLVGC